MLINFDRLHEPALLMKLGGDADLLENPSLGQAIAHVLQQPTDEQWLFDIVTDDGLMSHTVIQKVALTEEFTAWKQGEAESYQPGERASG